MEWVDSEIASAALTSLGKVLFSVAVLAAILGARALLIAGSGWIARGKRDRETSFWIVQGSSIAAAVLAVAILLPIWIGRSTELATTFGLATAGFAFALQKVIVSFAGYLAIIRGKVYRIGDRIAIGDVRGDVVFIGFVRTQVMEMGHPGADTAKMWIKGLQYTGRFVNITNDKIFEEPVFNYSREFPYIWDEITFPIHYRVKDRAKAEEIVRQAAARNTNRYVEESAEARGRLERKYFLQIEDPAPRVYWRLTDDWLEMTVRILCPDHGIRRIKDAIAREVLEGFDRAGIVIANETFGITGFPPVRLEVKEGALDHGRA